MFLTPPQVRERTGFAVQTLANWRSQEIGPPFIRVGRRIRYDADALDAWVRSQPSTAKTE